VFLYALTIFCSAFLLFFVQPLMGKFLLPWFGGAPAVWTTCMLFFQGMLLIGYTYAHFLGSYCQTERQRSIHLALLVFSILVLASQQWAWNSPLFPGAGWKLQDSSQPVWRVTLLLTISVGLPFLVLSTTGPLLQRWFSRSYPGPSPYRLYALSNLGSLLALIGYPLLAEPFLPLKVQSALWTSIYAFFVLLCGVCSTRITRKPEEIERSNSVPAGGVCYAWKDNVTDWSDYAMWFGLSAGTSALLLAVTNQLCQEVAVVPFLWVLPLSLYLLSFILCFESDQFYRRCVFQPAMAVAVVLLCIVLFQGLKIRIPGQALAYSFILFTFCMVCHGELSRLKPSPIRLTAYYLMIALGGALGGVFVALVAPLLFNGFWELHWSLWFCCLLVCLALLKDCSSWIYHRHPGIASVFPVILLGVTGFYLFEMPWNWLPDSLAAFFLAPWAKILLLCLGFGGLTWLSWWNASRLGRAQGTIVSLMVSLLLVGILLHSRIRSYLEHSIWTSRNFYGVLAVLEEDNENALDHRLRLRHGRITHGLQFQEPTKRRLPTTYYGLNSGLGLALQCHPKRHSGFTPPEPLRIGVVGLGVGTIAAYARPGDTVRFYEINPDVIRLSRGSPSYFSYVRDCLGRVEVVAGDARLAMEHELVLGSPQEYDLLAIDAFSSDSIPVHLLTREALEVYLSHLRKPDGILALHITNRYLDLKPVVWELADHLGLQSAFVHSEAIGDLASESQWMLLAWNRAILGRPEIVKASTPRENNLRRLRLWTDDYSNLLQVLRW
jgi:hypothetical protein